MNYYYQSLQQTIKAFLSYLGFRRFLTSSQTAKATHHAPSPSAATAESQSQLNEEPVLLMSRGIRQRGAVKKPPKPPIKSGSGAQHHFIKPI